eukprot:SAG25_NODE_100_length_15542_cov_15.293337_6_plen_193_part_00
MPIGYEIDYYGEFFDSVEALEQAGQGESQYVIGYGKRNNYTVLVNGERVSTQFARVPVLDATGQQQTDADGKLMWIDNKYKAKMLGHVTTADADTMVDLRQRMGHATKEFLKGLHLWKHTRISRKSKLRMFHRHVMQLRLPRPLPAVWGSAENYCVPHVTPVMPMDLRGTFLGCVRRVRVCSMAMVSKSCNG